jgi:uncharacterized membrane protein HdeD (DUF308 family)
MPIKPEYAAFYFLLDGISEIGGWVRLRPQAGSGWLLFGGIVSIWLGIMIWGQFPLSGVGPSASFWGSSSSSWA